MATTVESTASGENSGTPPEYSLCFDCWSMRLDRLLTVLIVYKFLANKVSEIEPNIELRSRVRVRIYVQITKKTTREEGEMR